MKKLLIITLTVLMPLTAGAALNAPLRQEMPQMQIPAKYTISGETKTLEWGCPIENEFVEADNKKSAMNHLISQCLEQVSRAAQLKPEVTAVIQASVIMPDLSFQEKRRGLHLVNGTIFLETVVSVVKSAQ